MRRLLWFLPMVLSGCGGAVSPELYRIAIEFFTPTASCYTNNMLPNQVQTQGAPALITVEVWDSAEGVAYLSVEAGGRNVDMGNAPDVPVNGLFEGTRGADGWTFVSERTVETTTGGVGTKQTDKTRAAITFNRGGSFKGTVAVSSSRTCEGAQCPATSPSCSIDGVEATGSRIQVDWQRAP